LALNSPAELVQAASLTAPVSHALLGTMQHFSPRAVIGLQRLKHPSDSAPRLPLTWNGFDLFIGAVLEGDSFLPPKKLYSYNSKEKTFSFIMACFKSCITAAVREKNQGNPLLAENL